MCVCVCARALVCFYLINFYLIRAVLNRVLLHFLFEVWPVTVKPRGLGCSKSLTGESRLCLTFSSLILVRVGVSRNLPSVTIPLMSVRRFGHLDGSFFLELGRSAPSGAGEVWMEAPDQGGCKRRWTCFLYFQWHHSAVNTPPPYLCPSSSSKHP